MSLHKIFSFILLFSEVFNANGGNSKPRKSILPKVGQVILGSLQTQKDKDEDQRKKNNEKYAYCT